MKGHFRFIINYRNRVWKQEVKMKKSERASLESETASVEPVTDPGEPSRVHVKSR